MRARRLAAPAACATCSVAVWIIWRSPRQGAAHELPTMVPEVPLEAHWLLGVVQTTHQTGEAEAEDPWANPVVHALSGSLELRSAHQTMPLRVVSRDPLGMCILGKRSGLARFVCRCPAFRSLCLCCGQPTWDPLPTGQST